MIESVKSASTRLALEPMTANHSHGQGPQAAGTPWGTGNAAGLHQLQQVLQQVLQQLIAFRASENNSPPGVSGNNSTPGVSGNNSPLGVSDKLELKPGAPDQLKRYTNEIEAASKATGVPSDLLAAQIWQESRANPEAATTNGGNGLRDSGLLQVNQNTFTELQNKHPELQGKSLADPATNILAGAFYMKDLHDQFGNWDLALRAYNSGPNGVDRNNPHATPAGTGDPTYVQKVNEFREIIRNGGEQLPG